MEIVIILNIIILSAVLAGITGLFVYKITVEYEKVKRGEKSTYFKKIK